MRVLNELFSGIMNQLRFYLLRQLRESLIEPISEFFEALRIREFGRIELPYFQACFDVEFTIAKVGGRYLPLWNDGFKLIFTSTLGFSSVLEGGIFIANLIISLPFITRGIEMFGQQLQPTSDKSLSLLNSISSPTQDFLLPPSRLPI